MSPLLARLPELLLMHLLGLPGQCWAQPHLWQPFWSRHVVWEHTAERQTCTFKAKPNAITCILVLSLSQLDELLTVPPSSALPAPTCTGSAGARDMPSVFGVLEDVLPKLGSTGTTKDDCWHGSLSPAWGPFCGTPRATSRQPKELVWTKTLLLIDYSEEEGWEKKAASYKFCRTSPRIW